MRDPLPFVLTALLTCAAPVAAQSDDLRLPGYTAPDEFAEPIEAPPPTYPRSMRRAGIEGRTIVKAWVTAEGDVREASVLRSSHPDLDEAAVVAVRRWRFRPARIEGRPVPIWVSVPISFQLTERPLLAEATHRQLVPGSSRDTTVYASDLRRVRWGMSRAEVLGAEAGEPRGTEDEPAYDVRAADVPAELRYYFEGDRLIGATYHPGEAGATTATLAAHFGRFRRALEERYGTPNYCQEQLNGAPRRSFENALETRGASAQCRWYTPRHAVQLLLHRVGREEGQGPELVVRYGAADDVAPEEADTAEFAGDL